MPQGGQQAAQQAAQQQQQQPQQVKQHIWYFSRLELCSTLPTTLQQLTQRAICRWPPWISLDTLPHLGQHFKLDDARQPNSGSSSSNMRSKASTALSLAYTNPALWPSSDAAQLGVCMI